MELTPGKLRNLMTLADENGRFKMLAIDQRTTLQKMLAKVVRRDPKSISYDEVVGAKQAVTLTLAPYATAVLTDPNYGYPSTVSMIPGSVGLLLTLESADYELSGPGGRERRSALMRDWTVEKVRRAGANAAKLLLYYHPDASEETNRHQQALARRVGEECARHDVPFLLELVAYPLDSDTTDTPEFARRKPELVARSAAEFSRAEYGVDLLKLEFPANLKYCYQYCRKGFDEKDREPVYDRNEVRSACLKLDAAAGAPWVILSAGVGIEEFLVGVELATAAGCSGFLCGRAIWQESLAHFPDLKAMEAYLVEEGAINFLRANAAAERALAWYDHRRFGGIAEVAVAGGETEWYRGY
jgi:tagatose 1,6-diphosphate aldolase